MRLDRPGVFSGFPSVQGFLSAWDRASPIAAGRLDRLMRYADGERFSVAMTQTAGPDMPFGLSQCAVEMLRYGQDQAHKSVSTALREDGAWLEDWRRAIAYLRWGNELYLIFHLIALREFEKSQRAQRLAMLSFSQMVFVMSNCFVLGWRVAGMDMFDKIVKSVDLDICLDSGEYGRRKAQYFALRLVSDWAGRETYRRWPSFSRTTPAYERLLACWREPDEKVLQAAVLIASDLHMHQSRFDRSSDFYDFHDYLYMYCPFEILLLLRLRSWSGLSDPTGSLRHPILSTSLGTLPAESAEYSDDLLARLIVRVKSDVPHEFAALISA